MIRVLHPSDLHIRPATLADQEVVLKAALADIRSLNQQRAVDLVVFSGDLTFSAQNDQFDLAEEKFLVPLLEALRLDRSRIVLVPGNHDIDRDRISRVHERGLSHLLTSRSAANELLDDGGEMDLAIERTRAWIGFVDRFYDGIPGFERLTPLLTVHSTNIADISVAMASVHSAWRATGASEDADRAKLIVGDRQMLQAVEACASADVRGVAMHHPSSWLVDWDAQDVQRELHQFHLMFTGHTHVANPQQIHMAAGSYLVSAAGSLYGSREWINSFNVIDMKTPQLSGTIHFRSYFDSRRAFDAGVDIANGGEMSFELAARGSNLIVAQAVADRPKICRKALLRAAHDRTAVGFGEPVSDQVEDVLVTPVLTSVSRAQWNATRDLTDPGPAPKVDPIDRLASERVLVVVGDADSGVTTTLEWIAAKYSELFPQVLPVRISGREVTKSPSSIERAIRVALAGAGSAILESEAIPPCIVALDDIDARLPRARQQLKAMCSSITTSTENLYVLGARPTQMDDLTKTLLAEGVQITSCHVGRWGRKQLRQMANIVDSDAAELILEQVTNIAMGEGVGGRPYMLTSLIHVVSADPSFARLSDPTFVTERHVGLLLGRDSLDDSRWQLDYRNREGVLGALAEHYLVKASSTLPRNEVEGLLREYFDARLWEESASGVVDTLIRARVLRELGNAISFAQPAFLGLFAAKRYFDDKDFAETLRKDALRRPEIIRHVAALNRNDRDLLARADEVLSSLSSGSRAPGDMFKEAVLRGQWDAIVPQLEIAPAATSEIDDEASDEFLDRMWDSMESVMLIDPTKPLDPETLPRVLKHMISTTLVSAVLKHSEMISDRDAKIRMLGAVLGHWADSIILLGSDEKIVGFARQVLHDNSGREGTDSGADARKLEQFLENLPPLIVCAQMEFALASQKLGGVLSELIRSPQIMEDPGRAMMVAVLGAQTRHEGWAKVFRDVMARHGTRPLIGRAMTLIALVFFDASAVSQADRSQLEDGMAEIYLRANGFTDPGQRATKKGEYLTGLRARWAQIRRQCTPERLED